MSSITATYDLANKVYVFTQDGLAPSCVDVIAGIDSGGQVVPFSNFSYGFRILRQDNSELVSGQWPGEGVELVSTDQPILEVFRAQVQAGTGYTLVVWFENWGVHIEGSYQFETPAAMEAPPEPV